MVLVGEDYVGKHDLFHLVSKTPAGTGLDNAVAHGESKGYPVEIDLRVTAASRAQDTVRPFTYPRTNLFALIFDVKMRDSLVAIQERVRPQRPEARAREECVAVWAAVWVYGWVGWWYWMPVAHARCCGVVCCGVV